MKSTRERDCLIRLVGYGIVGLDQLTLEGLRHAREARSVLYLGAINRSDLLSFGLERARSLSSLYVDGSCDDDNYDRLVTTIIAEVTEYSDVAVLLPGHPLLGVSLAPRLQEQAREHGWEFVVVDGVSSFDAMIRDLQLDPLERGTTLIDANRFLLFEFDLEPRLNTFIYHVCSVGTRETHYSDPSRGNQVALLQQRLLRYYPESHLAYLISSGANGRAAVVHTCCVDGLVQALDAVSFSTSLFLPARPPTVVNRRFLALLTQSQT
jgi:uncharacterized protein YabN with tetrapyrrole methylase and pyrophosphatase domain